MNRSTTSVAVLSTFLATIGFGLSRSAASSLPPGPWDPYFSSPTVAADLGTNAKAYGVAAGDFNGDGNPDMVIGNGTVASLGWAASPTTLYTATGTRTFGVAVADFDNDGKSDIVVAARSTGYVYFLKGNGDGTFATAAQFPWKLETYNATSPLVVGDVNGDGHPDIVWGSITTGADAGGSTIVNDGDVRVFYGSGDSALATMFTANTYVRSGVTFAAGTLMARIATATSRVMSLAVADVDGNGRADVIAGGIDGAPGLAATNTVIRTIWSNSDGTFTLDPTVVYSHSSTDTALQSSGPIYYPAQVSASAWAVSVPAPGPWGLAFADMNGDGHPDLLVADRSSYVYEYLYNPTTTHFDIQSGFTKVASRPYAFLGHDSMREFGYTPSLATADINGDGKPDIVLGMESGTQTTSAGTHDGWVVLDLSTGSGYAAPVSLGDVGVEARGVNLADVTGDGRLDVVTGSYDGLSMIAQASPPANVFFLPGTAGGGFGTPTPFAWRLDGTNATELASGDLNHDGKLDLVYGSTSVGSTGGVLKVNDGDVRVLYGNGDGTFQTNSYNRAGTDYAAGVLVGRVGGTGSTASSLAVGDVTGDGWPDVIVGGLDAAGTNTVVQLIRNNANGTFSLGSTIVSQTTSTSMQDPIYWPAVTPASTPWGLALGDANGDGSLDLFVGDRSQYVYRFDNNGTGSFTLHVPSNPPVDTRPNISFAISVSPPTGFTPSLAAGDLNGDGKADIAVGLYSGATNQGGSNDGGIYLGLSSGSDYNNSGLVADVGTQARGMTALDLDADGALDLVTGTYEGKVYALHQLTPKDSDGDGISDYVDNAPNIANAPRLDMNIDGAINRYDQLDNDYDTVLGDPTNPATWQRLGDPADADDDNDGIPDTTDNCKLVANADQADRDGDGVGDACDPLDNRDPDGDGVPNSIRPGDPLFPAAQAAAAKWASADQHFVIRIDALGRMWQSEFTETLADAAMAPDLATFQAECTANYANGYNKSSGYTPDCAALQVPGGKDLPVTLATIPKMLWTDPAVVNWINSRNDSANLEIAQHGTYHVDNNLLGDWANLSDRNWAQCETCGFDEPENFEYLKVGHDTLLGNYTNPWIVQSNKGVTPTTPKIDWSSAAHPLLTYIAPYDTSDPNSREAMAELGYHAFSASSYEESGPLQPYMSPEGSHMYAFDKFGMFHASAFKQVTPGDTSNLQKVVDDEGGNLHVWLIEEVDWDNSAADNHIDPSTFAKWNDLLDFVKSYPDSVAMTTQEVALAKAFDNAPTVANPDQADGNHNGIGDVVDGAHFVTNASGSVGSSALTRDTSGALHARLVNGAGTGIAGQQVTFTFDSDGTAPAETFTGTTGSDGSVSASVTASRPAGDYQYAVDWNGLVTTATGAGDVSVSDTSHLSLATDNPTHGQVTDDVAVGATLTDSHGDPVAGKKITFGLGGAHGSGTTDGTGLASATLTLTEPGGPSTLSADWAGDAHVAATSASSSFTVDAEDTTLVLDPTNPTNAVVTDATTFGATLTEIDGAPIADRTISFSVGAATPVTGTTDADGHATATVHVAGPAGDQDVNASWAGDSSYLASAATSGTISVGRQSTQLALDATPVSGRPTTMADVGATLTDANGGAVAGATVTFTLGTETTTGVTDLSGYADASLPIGGSSGETLTLGASFDGDGSFTGSTAQRDFLAVDRQPTLTLDAANPTGGQWDANISVGGTLVGDDGQPISGAQLSFQIGTASASSATTDSHGHATVSLVVPTSGTQMKVSFGGDSTYVPSTATAAFTVQRRTPQLALSGTDPSSGTIGSTVTFHATVTGYAATPLNGETVTFTLGASTTTGVTDANGVATGTLAVPTTGATSVGASFAGNTLYTSASDSHPFTVNKRTATVTPAAANPTSGQLTDSVTFAATLTDAGAPMAGKTLAFNLAGTTASGTTDSAGRAAVTLTLTGAAGNRSLTVSFAGDAQHSSASAGPITFVVVKESSALTAPTSVAATKTGKFTVSVTLRDDDGAPIAGRVVQILPAGSKSPVMASGTTNSSGTVTLSGSANKNRTSLTISFSGDATYLGTTKPLTVTGT